MSELSPVDASVLALLAENRKSPAQVKRLLDHMTVAAKPIAKGIVAPRSRRASKANRKTAKAIRYWAATNGR